MLAIGRPMESSRLNVLQTVVSVGPYTLTTVENRCRSSAASGAGSASPPVRAVVPVIPPGSSDRHTEGVAWTNVTPSAAAIAASAAGLRAAPAARSPPGRR